MRNVFKKAAAIAVIVSTVGVAAMTSPAVFASTKTATFQVSLTIQDDCVIGANALNFGTSGALSGNVDQTTTLAVTCTAGTPYNVALDAGTATGSTVAERKLLGSKGSSTVGYNLYSNAARTQVWGETVGTDTQAGTGTGAAQNYTVFGRVPAQDTPAADTYVSTITATVVF